MRKKAILLLSDGSRFEGQSAGAEGTVIADLVFTTGLVGYLEGITDPAHQDQILVQTFPLIGNYGLNEADMSSKSAAIKGYVIGQLSDTPSNFRSEGDLPSFLKKENVVAISGIDTRALTKILRSRGKVKAVLTTDPAQASLDVLTGRATSDLPKAQSDSIFPTCRGLADRQVILWNLGASQGLYEALQAGDHTVCALPKDTDAKTLLDLQTAGIVISDGPGDLADYADLVPVIKEVLAAKVPLLGIGLGHLLLAQAQGLAVTPLIPAHHGAQAVRDLQTGRLFLTNQSNHETVALESLDSSIADLRYQCVNDQTCAGLDYKTAPAIGLQFRPEGRAGVLDGLDALARFFELGEE
ncbi:carbamoyl phosphate synthase small subunit [Peptococcus simiae]|uniref:carbamoyl-phosphate synthase (glutamine-hydrolyzing) n=1 Tax=Peptococcus simiae TaxID=1643805 RepID=A0ABW9H069_9FIRM